MAVNQWVRRYFGDRILTERVLKQDSGHQLFYLRFIDGSEWIYKRFAQENWLGTTDYRSISNSEALKYQVNSNLAQHFNNYQAASPSQIFEEEHTIHLLYPYHQGKTIQKPASQQAFMSGQVLARIHSSQKPDLDFQYWPALCWPSEFKLQSWIMDLIHLIESNPDYKRQDWVASHRDLHMGNLLWSGNQLVAIIDWESAGLIHPFVELIGLAINCAAVPEAIFCETNFSMTLKGYQSIARLPQEDELLWYLCFHSWLLWLLHIGKMNAPEQLKPSLDAMNVIKCNLKRMQKIYLELQ
ncbi:phosphotransferase enzyme family protein [Legionella sp. 16cNR16C]|uniref:phosphotransferase enzyme family protein n=1 Tax=Legionella sp. 16cNR16C TaxID=2905656 RepID=UPI001E348A93|nr:phosphotransferase [Legionella sp. 16cNR16C]MCE3045325.1 aminoglycoside phosphotransferase family protein [Legionella sp. 16cNR16C]